MQITGTRPCSAEDPEQLNITFKLIKDYVTYFRAGVFRAGTYPSDTFGWEWDLLKEYRRLSVLYKKPNIVDMLDFRDIEKVDPYAGAYQVNMRQAQNFALLTELGRQKKPVFLKRGTWMTYDETMGAIEYLVNGGNEKVHIIERGSVSFLDTSRWEPSMTIISKIKKETKIPVIIDGSHGTGDRDMVAPISKAGISAGADGVLIECRPEPEKSLSDSEQALSIFEFTNLCMACKYLRRISE